MRILLAEDDVQTGLLIEGGLVQSHHDVARVETGPDALRAGHSGRFDVAILDRMLPEIDGTIIVERWRSAGLALPVLMLSALGSVAQRVSGLDSGADDYLVKPFAMEELLARLMALQRRGSVDDRPTRLCIGDLELDLLARRARRAGRDLYLQAREFDLLTELVRHAGRPLTRKMLLASVWGIYFDPKTNIVESHISRLRTKLRERGADPIETLYGAGYRLRADA